MHANGSLVLLSKVNFSLSQDPDLAGKLPIKLDNGANALFAAVKDGIVLCKIINS
jgi:hypothetical protein